MDLPWGHFERLARILFVADLKLKLLPGVAAADDDLPRRERRRQGDADDGDPTRTVLNDQRALAVDIHIGHGIAVNVELEDFDSARYRALLRQGVGKAKSGGRAEQNRRRTKIRRRAKKHPANQGSSTLARICNVQRRELVDVPGPPTAALRRML